MGKLRDRSDSQRTAARDPTTDGLPALVLQDLSVSFGGVAALTDLNLVVNARDLVAVIGPNGAGKTTLLNAVCKVVPFRGEAFIRGRAIANLSSAGVAQCGVGRSFQDPPLLDRETVFENVMCGGHRLLRYGMADQVFRRGRVRREEDRVAERVHYLLDMIGLTGRRDDLAGSLPFGSRKLLDIARAMVAYPRLLLLDEPSSGIDKGERERLTTIILDLHRQEEIAILAVEHHMDLVRATASHVFAMQSGRAFMHGTPEEVLDSERFRTSLVGGSQDPL